MPHSRTANCAFTAQPHSRVRTFNIGDRADIFVHSSLPHTFPVTTVDTAISRVSKNNRGRVRSLVDSDDNDSDIDSGSGSGGRCEEHLQHVWIGCRHRRRASPFMPLLRTGRHRLRVGTTPTDETLVGTPDVRSKTARHRLQQHLVTALRVDPSLLPLCVGGAVAPLPLAAHAASAAPEAPASERPFPYGVARASASLTLSALRPQCSTSPARSAASLRDLMLRPASKSQPLRVGAQDLDLPDDAHASSASLRIHAALPMQPLPDPLPLIASEEQALPAQLSASGRLSRSRRGRNTFIQAPRHAHTPPSFNPFATAFLPAPAATLDVMCHVTLDALPVAMDAIRASILLPFAAVPPRHHPHFVSLVHGVRPPSAPFIFEPYAARVWQEDATWRKEVRGTKPLSNPLSALDAARTARARGHPHWPQFVAACLARMLAVSAGLQQRGHECLRSVVALQCIREMLRLRSVMRAALRRASRAPPTAVTLPRFGTLAVTPDGWLALDGSARPDPAILDPNAWRKEDDVARGLVAWTNAEVDVATDICAALRTTRLSINAAPHWCRLALHACAARDVDSAIAVVGVVRFLFLRKWIPTQPNVQKQEAYSVQDVDLPHAGYDLGRAYMPGIEHQATYSSVDTSTMSKLASSTMDQLCANEFIDRAVAVPDIERCLPSVLDLGRTFVRGHDIDCGALTTGEVVDAARGNGGTTSRRGKRGGGGTVKSWEDECDDPSWSTLSFRAVRRRHVVMSVWTDTLSGDEWCIPPSVGLSIDFRVTGTRYRLSAIKGDVRCRRVGGGLSWSRRTRRRSKLDHVDACEAVGATALCNALDRVYGDLVCFHVLAWLHRGVVRLHDTCVAAAFVPRRSLGGSLAVNRRLPFQICRRMVFARKGHQLFWLPGEDLPPFRVRDCPNGTYQLTEVQHLPAGVELCRAEISKDFG